MYAAIKLWGAFLLISGTALAQNLTVRGSVTLTPRNDVAVTGTQAVAVGSNSLAVVSYSNPQSPSLVGQVAPGVGTLSAVTLRGDFAYCAGQGSGVVVVDISTPSAPDWVRNVQGAAPIVDVSVGDTFLAAATGLNVTLFGLNDPDQPHLLTAFGRAANQIAIDASAHKIHCGGPTGAFVLSWTVNQGIVTLSESDDFGSSEYTSVGLGDDYVNVAQGLQFSALHKNTYSLAGQYGTSAQIRAIASGNDFSLVGLATGGVEYLRQTGNTPQFASSAQAPAAINGLAFSANEQYVLAATQNGVTVFENSPLGNDPVAPLPGDLSLSAYPNPFNSRTTITWNAALHTPAELRVFDVLGRTVLSRSLAVQTAALAIDFAGLSAGNYVIEVITRDTELAPVRVLYLP